MLALEQHMAKFPRVAPLQMGLGWLVLDISHWVGFTILFIAKAKSPVALVWWFDRLFACVSSSCQAPGNYIRSDILSPDIDQLGPWSGLCTHIHNSFYKIPR